MESQIAKKNQIFREEIRRSYHQDFKRSKRKQMFECPKTQQLQQVQDPNLTTIYWNILNFNTAENLRLMDQQKFQCNLQMLKQIISSPFNLSFHTSLEPLACIFIQYFYESLKQCHNSCQQWAHQLNVQNDDFQSVDQACRLVALNKMMAYVKPNDFIALIGLIYFEIVPHNMVILKKVVNLMKQILHFSLKDQCVVADSLRKLGQFQDKPVNQTISRASVILVLMNITYNQDYDVLKIVEESQFIQSLAEGMEVYGFTEEEKQNIAGLYTNFIEYISEMANKIAELPYQDEEKMKFEMQEVLYLPIYEELIKMNNENIIGKMMIVSTILFKVINNHNLDCRVYFCDLCQQYVRNIIVKNEYYENSQDLFLIMSDEFTVRQEDLWLLDFLRIILDKYTYIYYSEQDNRKERSNNGKNVKSKCLRKISQLLTSCERLLCRSEGHLSLQQGIVQVLIELWCKQQLFQVKGKILSFLVAVLKQNGDLAEFMFHNYEEVLIAMMNESYEFANQKECHNLLVRIFFVRLQEMEDDLRQRIIRNNLKEFADILARLQDYCTSKEGQIAGIEGNISRLQSLLQGSQFIDR